MATFRKVSEVVALLEKHYDGPISQVEGRGGKTYDYIPWNVTVRQLDKVFGPAAWSATPGTFEGHPAEGVYLASVTITATAIDDETGERITFSRPGFGRAIAQPSKAERERGLTVSADLGTHDTAASAAGSDALSKGAKLLGNAFGLFFYDKGDPTSSQGGVWARMGDDPSHPTMQPEGLENLMSRAPQAPAKSGYIGNVSPAQAGKARANGWNDDQLKRLLPAEVKRVMDGLFGKAPIVPVPGNTRKVPAKVEVAPTEVEELDLDAPEGDGYPF